MKKLALLGISFMFLYGCNQSTNTASIEEKEEVHTEETHQHESESSMTIKLNNSEKWVVNEEMKPFALKGEELVNQYLQKGETDFKTLAEQIKEQNTQLIKNCTMEGKSHDELHKWLHPHLEIVKALENEIDTAKANEIVLKLEHSYKQYHEYFK